MRKIFIFVICIFIVFSNVAVGENILTTQSFVDSSVAQKQDKIPANNGTEQILMNTGTPGNVATKDIYDSNASYGGQSDALIDAATMNAAVQNAIFSEFQCIEYDANGDCLLVDLALSPNRFPAPANQTQSKNGVTVTVNDGVYSFSGTATTSTEFWFELSEAYTFPRAAGLGGHGVMYFWNNKQFSDMSFGWYDAARNYIDAWSLGGKNRKSSTYKIQTGHTVKYVRVDISANTNMNGFSFAPMFVEDGVTTYTTFFSHTNPNNFMPASQ